MGRRFGQHFLVRQSVLEKIAECACPGACEVIVEIGPGRGALTTHLLARAQRVIAIEIDPVLVQYLRSKFREEPKLEVIEGDILKTPITGWGPLTVAGNLPYYITSPILERVLSIGPQLERAVFLVQKEVAERLTASAGTRDFGYLSVETQLLAKPELMFPVPAAAFRPVPKVDSAVVRLTPHAELPVNEPRAFLKFAAAAFAHKRKTLRNNLLARYEKEKLDRLPQIGKRAEQLNVAELILLWEQLGS